MNQEVAKKLLESGFGQPEMAAILRPVAMDPRRLAEFIRRWDSNEVQGLDDLVTPMFLAETRRNVLITTSDRRTVINFSDSQANYISRIQTTAVIQHEDQDFDLVDPWMYRLDLQVSSRSHITSNPVLAAHAAGVGTDSWTLPYPVRMAPQTPVSVAIEWDPMIPFDVIARVDVTLSTLRTVL